MHCATIAFMLIVHAVTFAYADDCMSGDGITASFVFNGICYWINGPRSYKTWQGAIKLCQAQGGSISGIDSPQSNNYIASQLTAPAFFGYYKQLDGTWKWVNSTSIYIHSFTDNVDVQMTIQNTSGDWIPSNVDATGHLYSLLCSLPHELLQCSTIAVANSFISISTSYPNGHDMPLRSGETITFTCMVGFQLSYLRTTQTATCLPTRKWSAPVIDCQPITCDSIDPPAYTSRNSSDNSINATVLYTCSVPNTFFYPGIRRMLFICGEDGKWVPDLMPCRYIRCVPPPLLYMGTFDTSVTLYSTRITYTCLEGYKFADGSNTKAIECKGDPPEWDSQATIDSLNCTAIYCTNPRPNLVDPTNVVSNSSTETQVGMRQMWFCKPGWVMDGGQAAVSAACSVTPSVDTPYDWDKSVPACKAIPCQGLVVQNATANAIEKLYPVGYPLRYTCDPGLVFPGGGTTASLECQTSGQWTWEPPISGCDISKCEDGWVDYEDGCYYVSDTSMLGLRYTAAELSCNDKHSNLVQITSDQEMAFVTSITYDVYKRDFWIGIHKNNSGQWSWTTNIRSSYFHFAIGYPEFNDCGRTSVGGWWKDRDCSDLLPYVCKKISICGPSPTIANGYAVDLPDFPVNVGVTITYSCNKGFMFSDGALNFTTSCLKGGFWEKIGNCVPAICPPINEGDYTVPGAYFDKTRNKVKDKVVYTCQNGLLFPNGSRIMTMECLPWGDWSVSPPACQELRCPLPAVVATTPLLGNNTYGSMDYYRCQPGYSFPDEEVTKIFSCTREGTWIPTGQYCKRHACPQYSLPFATAQPDVGVYEDVIKVECKRGYQFSDTSKVKFLKCTVNGNWSETLSPCQPTVCPGPTPPNVTNAYRNTDSLNSGTRVSYHCLEDFVYINGELSRDAYCDYVTLQWTAVPNGCVDKAVYIQTSFYYASVEAPDAQTFGMLGIVILVLLFVFVFLADGVMLPKYLTLLKKNMGRGTDTDRLVEAEEEEDAQ